MYLHFISCIYHSRTSLTFCGVPSIVPSIPGFGFSYNPERRGFDYPQITESFDSLMKSLGYATYVAQGGDIGSFISCQLGQNCPESCSGVLVNMLVAPAPAFTKSPLAWLKWKTAPRLFYTEAEMQHLDSPTGFSGAKQVIRLDNCIGFKYSSTFVSNSRHEASVTVVWALGFANCSSRLD
jgi:pimeloyl-ACP methyl ester carboxylesterase